MFESFFPLTPALPKGEGELPPVRRRILQQPRLRHQIGIGAPNHLRWRKYRAAAKNTFWVHVHHRSSWHSRNMHVDKYNIATSFVSSRKLARETFRLSSVRRLKRAETVLAGNSVI